MSEETDLEIFFYNMKNVLCLSDDVRKELRQLVTEAVAAAFTSEKAKAEMMTSSDVMSAYRLSRTTLWRLCKEGKLHPTKGGGRQQLFSSVECAKVLANK